MQIGYKMERFLQETEMSATTFGRAVARDPRLVTDIRNGREPRPKMRNAMEHFMNKYRETSQ